MNKKTDCASILLRTTFLVLCFAATLQAQTTDRSAEQFWPGVDIYWRLKPDVRLYFMSSRTKETGKSSELDVGASIDFFVKRMVKLKRVAGMHIDESKASPLLLRAGYHILASDGNATEHRLVFEGTPRYPLIGGAVISARNRVELRFQDNYSWRFRTRIAVEKEFGIYSYHIAPYVRAEFFYDSKVSKWSRTGTTAGCVFPIRKRSEIEVYFEHHNDTGNSPNRQVNALGITLALHF